MIRARAAVDRAVEGLLALLMASAVANVVWQVVSRFALGQPSSFTDELARYLLVWIGLLGAGYAVGRRLHVAVDVIPARLARSIGRSLTSFAHVAVFLFALFAMVLGGGRLVQLSFELGQTTAALGISLGWIYGVVPATGLLVMFYAAIALVEDLRGRPMISDVALLAAGFGLLLLARVPVAFAIGIATVLAMLLSIPPEPTLVTTAQRLATSLDSFALLAIPFFILAGELMNRGGIAARLIDFARALVGGLTGGLAHVHIVASMLFGSISGSAVAAASAVGSVMGPRMEREGYDRDFAAAVNISAATTGLVIPPSNILIVYSLASGGVSIAALFLAGYLPGILVGVALMAAVALQARRRGGGSGARERGALRKLVRALPSLGLPAIVMGGIVGGVFTATEASAVAVVYALALALLYGEVGPRDLPEILVEAAATTGIVMLLIGTSIGLSWILAYDRVPQDVASALLALSDSPLVMLLLVNVALLAVGTFMDMTPAVLIFTPIFLPVAVKLGIDPVHFGIVMVMNLCIGLCTPPVGTVLFVGCAVGRTEVTRVVRPLLPLYAAMLVALLVVIFVPGLSLWLPSLLGR